MMRTTRAFISILILCFALAVIVVLTSPPDEMITGRAYARDGDSIELNGHNLRLQGLDAPEREQICQDYQGKDYGCGRAAKTALIRLLSRGVTTCTGHQRDKYARLLVTCRVNGVNVAAELVRNGHAVAYGDYEAEERFAREDRRGIWSGRFEKPEDYRRHQREAE